AQHLKDALEGVVIAMITPMHEDYSLDLDGMRQNVRMAVEAGIVNGRGALIIGGGGGELAHLTYDERVSIAQAAAEAADGRCPILAGVQDNGTALSLEMCKRLQDVGVDGIQLGPPYFYDNYTDEDYVRFYEAVAPPLEVGVLIYNTWWTAPGMSSRLVERLATIPNVVGCKWSSPNFADYRRGYIVLSDRIKMIDNGGDIIGMHAYGARGFISGTGDFWPEYDLATWDALEAGDYRRAVERMKMLNVPFYAYRGKIASRTGGEAPGKKPAAALCGRAAGPSRPPCRDVTEEELAELKGIFRAAGVPMAGG
ncbi:MAG: dihydrodipicolinate synthase family protein, partial [Armatimonadota bacterium]